MGQLEKYGLYVLCLVIFLILGVTIWGNPERAPGAERMPSAAMRAGVDGAAERSVPNQGTAKPAPRAGDDGLAQELASLIGPVAKTGTERVGQDPSRSDLPKPAPADKSADKSADKANGQAGDGDKVSAVAAKRGSHVVQSGDSFDSIARTRLGNAALRAELQRLNPKVAPSKLRVGQELVLPSPAELALLTAPVAVGKDKLAKEAAVKLDGGSKPIVGAAADRAYTIGKGDTFERIARAELGSSKRVEELRELNPTVDPTRLRIGQRIKLPKQ